MKRKDEQVFQEALMGYQNHLERKHEEFNELRPKEE